MFFVNNWFFLLTNIFFVRKCFVKKYFPRKKDVGPKNSSFIRIHDNNLTMCPFCPWGGVAAPLIAKHLNRHFKFKPFKCSYCPHMSYSQGSISNHEIAKHEKDESRFSCDLCDFKSYSRQGSSKCNLKNYGSFF